MTKANLNSRNKRMRELAKKDKRAAKDEKRARKKADARTAAGGIIAPATSATTPAKPPARADVRSLAAAAFIRRMNKAL